MDNVENGYQGTLFENLNYKNNSDVRNMIDNLTLAQSIFFITKSLELAHSKGSFSILETEIISKSLSILNQNLIGKDDSTR